jgi:acyl-coenzyme A thioesterase PaaI-like protein
MSSFCLQDRFAANSICFGCGPKNEKGLRIKSMVSESDHEWVTCSWRAEAHHQAFPGMLNGGIIGSLLDCHCNWTAAYGIQKKRGESAPPCTVTAEYKITLLRPTPFDALLTMKARATEVTEKKAFIVGELYAGEDLCATCTGLFVAVKEGHPAYHRWG